MRRVLVFSSIFSAVLLMGGCAAASSPTATTEQTAPERVVLERPALVTAAEWGSNPAEMPEEKRHTPSRITIHHAGVVWPEGADAAQRTRNLQSWGNSDRNWPDLPYHYLIAPEGTIYEGRSTQYVPETNTNYDVRGHIGIQLWGNFEEQRTVESQLAAVVELVAWLCQEHGIDPATIAGHRDVAAGTVCPGKDLYRYVEGGQIQQWVRQRLAGETPQVTLLPEMEGGPAAWIPTPARALELP